MFNTNRMAAKRKTIILLNSNPIQGARLHDLHSTDRTESTEHLRDLPTVAQ